MENEALIKLGKYLEMFNKQFEVVDDEITIYFDSIHVILNINYIRIKSDDDDEIVFTSDVNNFTIGFSK